MSDDELELMRELYQVWTEARADLFDQADFPQRPDQAEHDFECRVCAVLGLPGPGEYEEE